MENTPLTEITNYDLYTTTLAKYQMGYIVICSVKSNAGAYCNPTKLGIDVPLDTKKNQSFIRIIKDGSVIDQFFDKEPLMIYRHIDNLEIQISSDGYKKDSDGYSHIVINGIDWAVNSRGMNFVTYDTRLKTVVDSVSFDTHMKNCKCIRHPPIDAFTQLDLLENKLNHKFIIQESKQQIWISALSHAIFKTNSEDEIKQLFKNIPPATGNLRTLQLAEIRVLQKIISLCHKRHIRYWISFGSLIGILRHSGFIPWDDDIDICVPFNEFRKLYECLKSDDTLECYVSIDKWRALFRVVVKDHPVPWIDVFLCDFSNSTLDEIKKIHNTEKKQYRVLQSQTIPQIGTIKCTDEIVDSILKIANSVRSPQCMVDEKEATTVVLAPNQFADVAWNYNDIFPLKKDVFENIKVNVPNDIESLLLSSYGNIWTLPDNLHREHFKLSSTTLNECKSILDEFDKKSK